MSSAGPYANLHLTPDRLPCQHPTAQFFTGWIPFLLSNQQCQSTEGIGHSQNIPEFSPKPKILIIHIFCSGFLPVSSNPIAFTPSPLFRHSFFHVFILVFFCSFIIAYSCVLCYLAYWLQRLYSNKLLLLLLLHNLQPLSFASN